MATDVVMPQMGESIAEGTIVRWIKKVGEKVDRDEPLFEISTDKVDAEIPSPAAGVVSEIRVKEGETVPINTVVALIGDKAAAGVPEPLAPAPAVEPPKPTPQADGSTTAQAPAAGPAKAGPHEEKQVAQPAPTSTEDALHQRSSPLVRKIAKEHDVDISKIHGSGIAGRVTKDDILGFIGGQEGQVGRVGQVGPASAVPAPAAVSAKQAGDRVE